MGEGSAPRLLLGRLHELDAARHEQTVLGLDVRHREGRAHEAPDERAAFLIVGSDALERAPVYSAMS